MLGAHVGSYRVARLLGAGGMGSVYLGVHPSIESRVAIKVLAPRRTRWWWRASSRRRAPPT
jgi:serine/threonine-protein kinase